MQLRVTLFWRNSDWLTTAERLGSQQSITFAACCLQMPGYSAADPLCQVLSIVQDLLQNRRNKLSRSQGLHVHSVITDLLSKVHQVARKVKVQCSTLSTSLNFQSKMKAFLFVRCFSFFEWCCQITRAEWKLSCLLGVLVALNDVKLPGQDESFLVC